MTATARARLPIGAVLATSVLLTAATPPAWFPGAWVLLVPGLMLQFALATGQHRPLWSCYLLGVLHMAAFSWSLRHVVVAAWAAIAVVGGLYYAATAASTRRLPERQRVWAFAVAVAGVAWLRAEMPEIPYPHGQPCHALWQTPWLLGSVRLGGEPLANALLALVAAAAVEAWRGWRLGAPPFRRARAQLALALLGFLVATWVGSGLAVAGALRDQQQSPVVAIAAIEPGLHPADDLAGLSPVQAQARWRTSWSERLLQPTLAVAGPGAIAPPDLVLWPESSLPMHDVVERGNGQGPEFRALDGIALHERVRLCVGAGSVRDPEQPSTPAAVLVDARGRYLGHQEKRRLVPGGEFLPFARWLPRALLEPFERAMRTAVRFEPVQSGRPLPLLQTAAGIPFAALVCYDNAFPGVAADEVREGARLLVVLSNESWYRGGGELDQLAAITVVRALATATPFVRCTTDGLSLAVDGSGHVVAALPRQPTPTPAARILQVSLAVGPGLLPPLAWLHPWLGWTLSAMVLLALLHPLIAWARLRWLGRTPAGGAGGGPRPALPAGGS